LRTNSAAAAIPPSVRNASSRSGRTRRHNWCLARHGDNRAHQGFCVRPRRGSHVYENSATTLARAAARRTASARRSGPEAGRGVLFRANGGGRAAPVAGREERGRRQFRRPWIRSAEQRRRPPSALVTATLPPRLTAADGVSVSIVFAGARCPHTATF